MKSIRWKIIALCAVVIVVPLALLNNYVVHALDRFASRELERHMENSAWLIGEQYLLTRDDAAARNHFTKGNARLKPATT